MLKKTISIITIILLSTESCSIIHPPSTPHTKTATPPPPKISLEKAETHRGVIDYSVGNEVSYSDF
jgi:hypothetical protein